ncbi:MAG: DUF2807 domain-containing protein [Muribaculaceae bacterium]|nr:DUF2807 domain-containing protein [Muribaculaceae bacterium]
MRQYLTILILILSVSVECAAQRMQRHTVNVGHFTELNVKHSINVDYRTNPDSAGLAVFVARPEMANAISFKNNGKGKLAVETQLDPAQDAGIPTVTIYSRYLTKIENSGDSTVRAFNVNAGPKFTATQMGNGRLSIRDIQADEISAKQLTGRGQLALSGECRKASLSCAGVGAIQADNLHADDVDISIGGPVTVGCYASGVLSVKGLGPAKIYYGGNPTAIRNRSAGPSLINIDE